MTLHRSGDMYDGTATIEQGDSIASVRCNVRVLKAERSIGGRETLKPIAWHGGFTVIDQIELVPGPATLILPSGQRGSITIADVRRFDDSDLGFAFRASFTGVGDLPI